ncbi:hypothetical protein [Carboxylicivirga sp. N1Y90]|uniref:hypothetical protein n=1 Tax=Carboxylicivirga fragile TaxID=3417571 RepID=UPI003D32ED03|nr:Rieske 2Fe-2S domain-containing protein [Marinilabiliaceae bacterium N1Y90]
MRRIIGFAFLVFISFACNKDNDEIIPEVRFSAEVDLDNPQYNGKNPFIVRPGGLNRIVGINGVVVFGVTNSEFYAFDLLCTHEHEKAGFFYVEMTEPGSIVMKCPECESEFSVAAEYGSVIQGPAKWALKRYQTDVRGSTLRIWN